MEEHQVAFNALYCMNMTKRNNELQGSTTHRTQLHSPQIFFNIKNNNFSLVFLPFYNEIYIIYIYWIN